MQAKNTLILSALCLTLGACSISVDGDGDYYRAHDHYTSGDKATVTLPNGDRVHFDCPEGTSLFINDQTDSGGELVYGCRVSKQSAAAMAVEND